MKENSNKRNINIYKKTSVVNLTIVYMKLKEAKSAIINANPDLASHIYSEMKIIEEIGNKMGIRLE